MLLLFAPRKLQFPRTFLSGKGVTQFHPHAWRATNVRRRAGARERIENASEISVLARWSWLAVETQTDSNGAARDFAISNINISEDTHHQQSQGRREGWRINIRMGSGWVVGGDEIKSEFHAKDI